MNVAAQKYRNSPHGKAKRAEYARQFAQADPDYWKNWGHEYYQRPEVKARIRAYECQRRKTDHGYRLKKNLRRRVNKALRGLVQRESVQKLVGCSSEHLKTWLTFWFQDGMSWENYGNVWHVDHRRPCASFDFSRPEQREECFHYTNLQPMFAAENLKKGAKYVLSK